MPVAPPIWARTVVRWVYPVVKREPHVALLPKNRLAVKTAKPVAIAKKNVATPKPSVVLRKRPVARAAARIAALRLNHVVRLRHRKSPC